VKNDEKRTIVYGTTSIDMNKTPFVISMKGILYNQKIINNELWIRVYSSQSVNHNPLTVN
jgi:hypothetical protein